MARAGSVGMPTFLPPVPPPHAGQVPSTRPVRDRRPTPDALAAGLTEGFTHAFVWASLILLVAAVVIAPLMNTGRPRREAGAEEKPVAAVHLG